MYYYAWMIGLPLAALFGVVISMWMEMREDEKKDRKK